MKEVSIDTNKITLVVLSSKKVLLRIELNGIKFGMLYELPFHDCLMKHMKEVSIDTNRITLVVLSSKTFLEYCCHC